MEHIMRGSHSKEFWIRQIEIAGLDNVSYSLEMAEFNENYEQASLIRDAMNDWNNNIEFNKSVDLYRATVFGSKTPKERSEAINRFRCGG